MLFGDTYKGFSTLRKTGATILRGILGDFDYDQFQMSPGQYGAVYLFGLYFFALVFVFLSMFVSIITDAYEDAIEVEKEQEEAEKRRLEQIAMRLRRWKKRKR